MPVTYVNIASSTVGSATSTVTFSSIPSTYTDLVLLGSIRDTEGAANVQNLRIRLNNDSTTLYSFTQLQGNGSAAIVDIATGRTNFLVNQGTNSTGSTANTFASFELYLPNYLSSTNKPASLFSFTENSATQAYINATAQLYRSTSTISRIDILSSAGNNTIAVNSSFYLYGIKKN